MSDDVSSTRSAIRSRADRESVSVRGLVEDRSREIQDEDDVRLVRRGLRVDARGKSTADQQNPDDSRAEGACERIQATHGDNLLRFVRVEGSPDRRSSGDPGPATITDDRRTVEAWLDDDSHVLRLQEGYESTRCIRAPRYPALEGWESSAYVMSCRGGSLLSDALRCLPDQLEHVRELIGKGCPFVVSQVDRLCRRE